MCTSGVSKRRKKNSNAHFECNMSVCVLSICKHYRFFFFYADVNILSPNVVADISRVRSVENEFNAAAIDSACDSFFFSIFKTFTYNIPRAFTFMSIVGYFKFTRYVQTRSARCTSHLHTRIYNITSCRKNIFYARSEFSHVKYTVRGRPPVLYLRAIMTLVFRLPSI